MSQHDLNISSTDANTGLTMRAAINSALQALGSMQSSTSAPATTYPCMLWYEVSVSNQGAASKIIYTGSKTSVSVTKVAIGSTLVFRVRSYTEVKKVKSYSDPVTLTVEVKLSAPVLLGKLSKSVVSLSWAKVTGAKGYEVYRSTSYAGTYTLVKTATTLKFSEKLGVGVKAYYKIRSYITVNGKKVYSDYSNIVLITN